MQLVLIHLLELRVLRLDMASTSLPPLTWPTSTLDAAVAEEVRCALTSQSRPHWMWRCAWLVSPLAAKACGR